MTLVLALRCREGAVLAADDQLSFRHDRAKGDLRVTRKTPVTKLLHTRGIAWGWGGAQDAEQQFGIEMFDKRTISAHQDRSAVQTEIQDALRAGMSRIEYTAELNLVIGWWSAGANKALLLDAHVLGTAVRSTFVDDRSNVSMVGSDEAKKLAEFALRTLGFGDFRNVGMEEAKIVASKAISDVSAVTDDVGQPAYIIGITSAGVEELDAQDVEAIASSAAVWTASLRATLAPEPTPSETTTKDTGLRPPE